MGKDKGYIRLYRSFLETEEWQKPRAFSEAEAWLWLLLAAHYSHEERIVEVGDKEVIIKRGQLLVTYRNLAKEWGWSKSSVSRYLGHKLGQRKIKIGTQVGTLGTLITICNYEKYNSPDLESGTASGTANLKKWDSRWDIKEEKYINKYKKENTHTLVKLLRGVWGEGATYHIICNCKKYSCDDILFATYCIATARWMEHNTPGVCNLRQQLTIEEFRQLVFRYDIHDIGRLLVAMENSKSIKKRTSVYHTLVSFINRDFVCQDRLDRQRCGDHYRTPQQDLERTGVETIVVFRDKLYKKE